MLEIPMSGIKKIEEIAQSSSDFISLSQGSIKVGGIPQEIKTYIQQILNTDKTDYYESCWGIKILREKIASTMNARHGTDFSAANVVPTHGCIGGLSLLYLTLLNPGDEVIIPEPAYPAYSILAQASRAVAKMVTSLKQSAELGWFLDIEAIKAATTERTKIIIFSNPWNPLGIIVPEKDILELIAWCEFRGIYLVLDEAYRDYVFEGSMRPGLTYMKESSFVVSANTFSKNMAMSGWRVGYLLVPEQLAKPLAGMQDALLNCLNNTAQYAALYALDHPEFTAHFYQKIKANRDLTLSLLQPLFDTGIFAAQKPAGGFFLFLKTQEADATDLCMSILHQAKVGLIPGKSFGPTGQSFIRLCYARDTELLHEGIDRIIKFFN